MRKAGLTIYSVVLWVFFTITSIVLFSIAFVIWLLSQWSDRRLVILHLWSSFWGSWYIWFNPLWRVRVSGRRKIPWRKSCILVSNHQSMLDILVLYHLFRPYKWLSKKENFNIPIIGWLMRLNRYLELVRGDPVSVKQLMEGVRQAMEAGNSIMMFPEGTRYSGGTLGPFREGAFRMALENKADIVPILLDGTAKALPKNGAILTGFTKIRVRVLDPIAYNDFCKKEPAELMNDVRELMSEEYLKLHSDEEKQ